MIFPEQIKQGRILLVDDDWDLLAMLSLTLRDAGAENLQTTTDPCSVLDYCHAWLPDLVLLDWQMRACSGRDVLEQIRAEIGGSDELPVLVLTGDLRPASRHEAFLAGATDFLAKPFDETELLLRMRNLLHMRFLTRHIRNENRILEERVHERATALLATQMQFLERLAAAAELRDDLTGKHTARVAHVSALLAEALGLGEEEVHSIQHATPLHDVGKLAVPETILRKPAPLSIIEFEVMKMHTVHGPKLVGSDRSDLLPLLHTAEEIAATHHERWDGRGYPNQLGEQDIPLSGRIVAVADVFDALSNERPYKAAWPFSESVRTIREAAGSHFDPLIVDVFLQVADDGRLVNTIRRVERSALPLDEAG